MSQFGRRSGWRILSLLLALGAVTPVVSSAPEVVLQDLGTLGGGYSAARGINEAGMVIGVIQYVGGGQDAFLHADGEMRDITPGGAYWAEPYLLNEDGAVIGRHGGGSSSGYTVNRSFLHANGVTVDLGSLDPGGPNEVTVAVGIDASGRVAGVSRGASGQLRAFLYASGRLSDISPSDALWAQVRAMSPRGHVVGYYRTSATSPDRGFLYDAATGQMTTFGSLGGSRLLPFAVNSSGQVCGMSTTSSGVERAFLYSAGSMTDLGAPAGATASRATLISEQGDVAGEAFTPLTPQGGGAYRAFHYSGGQMHAVGTFGGRASQPIGFTEGGHLVGNAQDSSGLDRAFLYSPSSGIVEIDAPWAIRCLARAVNRAGQVAGIAYTTGGSTRPFLWTDGIATDLGTLGGSEVYVEDMNDGGQVVGTSSLAGDASWSAFLATTADTTPPEITCPGGITVEATGPVGAVVTFTGSGAATASDDVTETPAISYSPASGSTFPLGLTTVTAFAADEAGNGDSCTFTVRVEDSTAPTIVCPATVTVEATGPDGAAVAFSGTAAASATDAVTAAPTLTYSPGSGSTFPLGSSTVTATAVDGAGNQASCEFTITVRDTTPPSLTCPSNVTTEAIGPEGAAVTFQAAASDLVDGTVPVTFSPASGSMFPLGTTTVTAAATDAAGNTSSCEFTVTVVDTTPPELACPPDLTREATSPDGATVTFAASASDLVDASLTLVYTPESGSVFALGATTVTVTATDEAGNRSSCDFVVTVVDTTPPDVSAALARTFLWPANNGLLDVSLTGTASDAVDASPEFTVSVFSDESNGSPPFSPDAVLVGETLRLRSQRDPTQDGRVYLVLVTATDAAGNVGRAWLTAVVPHNLSASSVTSVQSQAATASATAASTAAPPSGYATILSSTPLP